MNSMSLQELMDLIRLKKENPEKYKELLNDIAGVTSDIVNIAIKTAEEFIHD